MKFFFKTLTIIVLAITSYVYGQVGVGTKTPQENLHVVGNLQVTGGVSFGGTSTTVGKFGEVGQVLTSKGENLSVWQYPNASASFTEVQSGDQVDTKLGVTHEGSGGSFSTMIDEYSFTLAQKSLVIFSVNLSFSNIKDKDGGFKKANGLYGVSLKFSEAPSSGSFGVGSVILRTGDFYTPSSNETLGTTTGSSRISGTRSLILNSGTYKIGLDAYVFSFDVEGIKLDVGDHINDVNEAIIIPLAN